LPKKLHPDLNPGNREAEEKFKEVAGAYDLIGDPGKRLKFDNGEVDAAGNERTRQSSYHDYAASSQDHPYSSNSGFGDFMDSEDHFADLLRRARTRSNRRGQDLQFHLQIDFMEAIAGSNKRISLPDGSTIDVAIPPGIIEGQILRLRGKGAPGAGKGEFGDALVEVGIKRDRIFTRQGDDIYLQMPVSLSEAVLGAQIGVPTPTGRVAVTVPKSSNTGTKLRLKGKGAPKRGGGFGDQFISLEVVLPKEPDLELEAFVAHWKSGTTSNPRKDWE
jgi:DnaJ-class molecular chaperone